MHSGDQLPDAPQQLSLRALAEKYCCDKFYSHSYIPFYKTLFEGRDVRRLLEIGIGYEDLMAPFVPRYIHGASLRMWEEYFPKARIYACDIRPETLINEGRIESYCADQNVPADLLRIVRQTGNFDIIIDDGSHQTAHQILSARTLLPYVALGGVYIIEDVQEPDRIVKALGAGFTVKFPKRVDDTLVVIQL